MNEDSSKKFGKGRFLFRTPYKSDKAFVTWAILNGLALFSRFATNASTGGFNASSSFNIVSGILDAVLGTAFTALILWVIFCIYLVPRRNHDRKKL